MSNCIGIPPAFCKITYAMWKHKIKLPMWTAYLHNHRYWWSYPNTVKIANPLGKSRSPAPNGPTRIGVVGLVIS